MGAAPEETEDEEEEAAAPVGEPLGVGVVEVVALVPVAAVLVTWPVTGMTVVCPFITVVVSEELPVALTEELAVAVALAVEFDPEADALATVLGSAAVVAVDCVPGFPLTTGPPWPPTGRVMR
jgi:hypothetical protein